ncbi:MAG: ABC transporter permease [Thermoleophilia bacterium]|nr:ABC transporter permease [Thermoleophilia bacterium]
MSALPESKAAAAPVYLTAGRARWRQFRLQWHVLTRNVLQKIAIIYIALLVLVAITAPYIAPHPESIAGTASAGEVLQAPSWSHLFGTDEFGRDIFSRVLYGARISLMAGVVTVFLSVAIGSVLGVIAAGMRGIVDDVIMRVTDVFLSFPMIVLAIVIAAFWGAGLRNAIIALAVCGWPFYARLVRGSAVSVRERPYVRAAQSIGASQRSIIFRHILPGSIGPVLTMASLDLGGIILMLAGMSFLGVGAQPPTPEWGLMINESRTYFLNAWWYMAFPGIAISLTVLAFNLLGDGLNEVVNPRTRGRA